MPVSPNVNNYTLGRGALSFNKLLSTGAYEGYRDLGHSPNVTSNVSLEKLDHLNKRSAVSAKDKTAVLSVTPTLSFVLEEPNVENLALMNMGEIAETTQAADDNLSIVIANGYTANRSYSTGKRSIGVYKLNYDGGSADFTVGATLTGATGSQTWVILRVVGTTASGVLYLADVTGATDIVNDEVLSDDNGTPGAAVANGVVAFDATDLVVVDTATPTTFYDKTDDFTIDSTTGFIYIVSGGQIATDGLSITVKGGCLAATYSQIKCFKETTVEGKLKFVSDNAEGPNRELYVHRYDMTPDGDQQYISDEWDALGFTGEMLKDTTNDDSPYCDIITSDTA